ncbi:unnamed protein product, partial [Mesorhabditis belari]|uniref:Oxysterol-binding protein n=1 Tax=Mesorhabditis belari TaxID=2138241 RepID=A0AAF3J2H6_9BILA
MNAEVEIVDTPTEEHWKQWKNLILQTGWCGFDYTMLTLFPTGENVKMVVAILKSDKSFVGSIVWADNEDLICIDTYYVIEAYRGRGIGPRMWKQMLNRIDKNKPLMLKSEQEMMPKYMANGLPYVGPSQNCVEPKKNELLTVSRLLQKKNSLIDDAEKLFTFIAFSKLNSQQFDALCSFDSKVTGKNREDLLRSLKSLPFLHGGVLIDELGKIRAFTLISKALPEGSFKMAPLYAESDYAAGKVVEEVLETIDTGDAMIQVHIPDGTKGSSNLTPIFESIDSFIEYDSTILLSAPYRNPLNMAMCYQRNIISAASLLIFCLSSIQTRQLYMMCLWKRKKKKSTDSEIVINSDAQTLDNSERREFSSNRSTNDEDSKTGSNKNSRIFKTDVRTAQQANRQRRRAIPDRPEMPLSLWSIMKNCIGKELTKIPIPVNFSEPLSMLQRLTEDLEYSSILDKAVTADPIIQMCYVAAFAVSSYSTTGNRTTKPFNPILGETYECDRREDLGWRSLAEQVSHHPPAIAHHAEGRGWKMYQDFSMTSRFRGKYLSVVPMGMVHVVFPDTGHHYTFRKVTTTVHNIIVGRLWIENHGEMEIVEHQTRTKCTLNFAPYSLFSRSSHKKVTGVVKDSDGATCYVIRGTWVQNIDIMRVTKSTGIGTNAKLKTEAPRTIWYANPQYDGSSKMYSFSRFAVELNEPEDGVAPTDSRLRPDQRLLEEGRWEEANAKKIEVEDKQRARAKKREQEKEEAVKNGLPYADCEPLWFAKEQDETTGDTLHKFTSEYWECKTRCDWSRCPDLF